MPTLVNIYFVELFLICWLLLSQFKCLRTEFKVMSIFMLYTLINEFLCWNFATPNKWLLTYLYNVYFVLDILFFGWFFHRVYETNNLKRLITLFSIVGIAVCLIIYVSNGMSKIQNMASIVLAISLLLNSLLFFADTFLVVRNEKLTHNPVFWIAFGGMLWSIVFIFYSGPLYLLFSKSPELFKAVYICLNIINLINYLFIIIGISSSRIRVNHK